MSRLIFRIICVLALFSTAASAAVQQAAPPKRELVRVFLDCDRCDEDYLKKEVILLRQRQLLTGYQYYFNFGISYSFGSLFNNIVNPRFGGGGAGAFNF
jgi:hypothetical protein